MASFPNIVLITVDCLRVDHIGCYGSQGSVTPFLDQLAADGTLFLQAVAQGPGTTFAFPAIMSSTYPSMLGGNEVMSSSRPLVAETLQRAGYSTAAFVSNPYLTASFGYDRGFDVFDECYSSGSLSRKAQRGLNRVLSPLGISVQCPPYAPAEQITSRARDWAARASTPFFLWVHYMDVHWPYNLQRCTVSGPWKKSGRVLAAKFARNLQEEPDSVTQEEAAFLKAFYSGGIRHVDCHIGQLLELLREQGILDRSWIIVTADHGEEFGEHGGFFHTRKLYEELIRVPLIVRCPEGISAPRKIEHQVRHLDIVPTLADFLHLPLSETYEGASLLPFFWQDDVAGRPAVSEVTDAEHWLLALRRDAWKLILHLDPETLDVLNAELYDLQMDPGEERNLADEQPQKVAELQEELLAAAIRIQERAEIDGALQSEVDEDVVERLRALGYLG